VKYFTREQQGQQVDDRHEPPDRPCADQHRQVLDEAASHRPDEIDPEGVPSRLLAREQSAEADGGEEYGHADEQPAREQLQAPRQVEQPWKLHEVVEGGARNHPSPRRSKRGGEPSYDEEIRHEDHQQDGAEHDRVDRPGASEEKGEPDDRGGLHEGEPHPEEHEIQMGLGAAVEPPDDQEHARNQH
jgi:hypothetical protein